MNNPKINVAIIGASGYTGLELIKILLNHPKFEIAYIANTKGEGTLDILYPFLSGLIDIQINKANPKDIATKCDLAFLALPHKSSMVFAKELVSLGLKVIDLSADYRLELQTYQEYYCSHSDKDNLKNAVYGLPEFYKDKIKNANLVANPGCYPTASLLGLIPFVDMIQENSSVFIDAKSGVSGAGKNPSSSTHFVNINENMYAYNPINHRHAPEIKEKVKLIKQKDLHINFVPHLIPLSRGMLVSIYITTKEPIDANNLLKEFYKNMQFVRVVDYPVDIKSTTGTNYCDIYAICNKNSVFISSSIDNLTRGASSQAVVNANIMYGFDEDLGINKIPYIP